MNKYVLRAKTNKGRSGFLCAIRDSDETEYYECTHTCFTTDSNKARIYDSEHAALVGVGSFAARMRKDGNFLKRSKTRELIVSLVAHKLDINIGAALDISWEDS
jgi:hypothetical protein